MPEYSHIQTYIKCDHLNFQDVIRLFSEVINSLELDSKYFNEELEWKVSENSFMYVGGGAAPQKIPMGDRTLAYPTIELTRHDSSIIQIDEQELRYPAFSLNGQDGSNIWYI
ncbi:hypothetical protein [Paenibacillus sp. Marseille-Q9583]